MNKRLSNGQRSSQNSLFALIAVGVMILLAACSPAEKSSAPVADQTTRYDMKAVVVSVDEDSNKAVMDHEEIPGLMGAMRMSFSVPGSADREKLKPGAVIRAKLVMENNTMWVEGVEVLGEGEAPAAGGEGHSH